MIDRVGKSNEGAIEEDVTGVNVSLRKENVAVLLAGVALELAALDEFKLPLVLAVLDATQLSVTTFALEKRGK